MSVSQLLAEKILNLFLRIAPPVDLVVQGVRYAVHPFRIRVIRVLPSSNVFHGVTEVDVIHIAYAKGYTPVRLVIERLLA